MNDASKERMYVTWCNIVDVILVIDCIRIVSSGYLFEDDRY